MVLPACAPVQPAAGFTGSPTYGTAPLTVQFTSTSKGANAYTWSFGDGGTSPAQNPRHTYRTPGIYTVSLEARDACTGTVSLASVSNFVSVTPPATTLSITSNPPGAVIYVDNIVKGRSPLMLTDTPIGDHRITITLDGYEEYTRNIIVESATPLTIAAVLTGSVHNLLPSSPPNGSIAITSIPSGAEVYIDGWQSGIAPTIISEILPGNHQVTLSSRGYDNWSRIVSVGSGRMSGSMPNWLLQKRSPARLRSLPIPRVPKYIWMVISKG